MTANHKTTAADEMEAFLRDEQFGVCGFDSHAWQRRRKFDEVIAALRTQSEKDRPNG